MTQESKPATNQASRNETYQLDFFNHDHEVQFSVSIAGVSEEKALDTAKGIYFASDESIDHWDVNQTKHC